MQKNLFFQIIVLPVGQKQLKNLILLQKKMMQLEDVQVKDITAKRFQSKS